MIYPDSYKSYFTTTFGGNGYKNKLISPKTEGIAQIDKVSIEYIDENNEMGFMTGVLII